jgi:hypothetical protein
LWVAASAATSDHEKIPALAAGWRSGSIAKSIMK